MRAPFAAGFAVALCLAPVLAEPRPTAAVAAPRQYRAFWADAFNHGFKTPAQVDQLIAGVAAARGNAIIVQARQRGNSFYLRSLEPPAEDATWPRDFDPLAYLIAQARPRGIEVHAWFTITPVWMAAAPPRDERHIYNRHGPRAAGDAMWMTVGASGVVSPQYVDMGHPEVTRHTAEVILHAVKNYDLDGVHLDYIRYPEPAGGSGDWGYNPVALERFRRQELADGTPRSGDARWTEFRRRQVTQFVRQVYLRVNEVKPHVKVSGALITWGHGPRDDAEYRTRDAYTAVYQDWRAWLEEGILDIGMPMNYFSEPRGGMFYDRWIEYEKDRQYGRMTIVGLGNYLSPAMGSMAQLKRALQPSRNGNRVPGVAFYSYANAARPARAGGEFFTRTGAVLEEAARVPEMPWKSRPVAGHLVGQLTVEGAPAWVADGATVTIAGEGGVVRTALTDAQGYFGAVDLAPGRYVVRLARNGREFYRSPEGLVSAGQTARFDARLTAAEAGAALPVLSAGGAGPVLATPANGIVRVRGANLGGRAQALVNGMAATIFRSADDELSLILPNAEARHWRIVLRQPGVESNSVEVAARAAAPEVLGVRRAGDLLEVYCTGLGRVAAGRPVLPVQVLVNGRAARVLSASGSAGQALFQVNVAVKDAASGTVMVVAGGVASSVHTWDEPGPAGVPHLLTGTRPASGLTAGRKPLTLDDFPRFALPVARYNSGSGAAPESNPPADAN